MGNSRHGATQRGPKARNSIGHSEAPPWVNAQKRSKLQRSEISPAQKGPGSLGLRGGGGVEGRSGFAGGAGMGVAGGGVTGGCGGGGGGCGGVASAAASIVAHGLAPRFCAGTFDAIAESSIDPPVHAASAATAQRGKNRVEFIPFDSAGSAPSDFLLNYGSASTHRMTSFRRMTVLR